MAAILPYQIVYYPRKRPSGYGFNVEVTEDFLAFLRTLDVDKELLERRARESIDAFFDSDFIKKYADAHRILGWQGNLLHHISLPIGNAAGMSFHEEINPGWGSHNIDRTDQAAACLAIMTDYLNYAAADLSLKNKTFVLADIE